MHVQFHVSFCKVLTKRESNDRWSSVQIVYITLRVQKLYEFKLLHFARGVAEARCILVTAVCVSDCPSLHSHITARTRI